MRFSYSVILGRCSLQFSDMSVFKKAYQRMSGYISAKNRLVLISVGVGIVAGLAAVFLKRVTFFLQSTILENLAPQSVVPLFLPLIGILGTVIFYKYIIRAKLGKSLTDVILSIEQKSSRLAFDKVYSHAVTGALTVGFGGTTGLEAPIVVTGSAIGTNIAQFFKLNYKERTVLLASGASAGIAAIFNSPIAGVLFAIEVLLPEFSLPTIIPLLVATASASVVSKLLYSDQLFFLVTKGWSVNAVPLYLLLGLIMGVWSVAFTKIVMAVKRQFDLQRTVIRKAILGGLMAGVFLFFLPPLYGEGYHTITAILAGNYQSILHESWIFHGLLDTSWQGLVTLAVILLIVKPIAAAVTIGAGGNGGVFAPALFTGALVGMVFSLVINQLGLIPVPAVNLIAAGMAGALSGIFHAPLTGIFLIAEVTGGYTLFVPLMVVSALSFFVSRYLEPFTVYTQRLARKGLLIREDRDKSLLSNLRLTSLIERDFSTVLPDATLGHLVDVVAHAHRNVFPVVNGEKQLLGVVVLDDIRELMFQQDLYDTVLVKELMKMPPCVLHQGDSIPFVMRKFDDHQAWNLPVVHNGKYVGFVSKSRVLSQYRDNLIHQTAKSVA